MMKSKIHYLFFTFCAIALMIGIYQLIDSRLFDAMLSLIYAIVFFIGGWFYLREKSK